MIYNGPFKREKKKKKELQSQGLSVAAAKTDHHSEGWFSGWDGERLPTLDPLLEIIVGPQPQPHLERGRGGGCVGVSVGVSIM